VSTGPRLLGLAADPALTRFRTVPSRFSGLYLALDPHAPVVDVEVPAVSGASRYTALALAFHPDRSAWRGRAGLSSRLFRARTEAVERILARHAGEYDVVFQTQSLFAPGTRFRERTYTLYSDNVYPLTRRHYPAWAPL
jgi:hypothetical protein